MQACPRSSPVTSSGMRKTGPTQALGERCAPSLPLTAAGLSDAQYEARERSRGGKRQVIVKIADHDEVILEEYADGQRQ